MAEEVIRSAEAGDYTQVTQLLTLLQHPFAEPEEIPGLAATAVGTVAGLRGDGGAEAPVGAPEPAAGAGGVCPLRVGGKPPAWAGELCVTCSS